MKKLLSLLICAICILSVGCINKNNSNGSSENISENSTTIYEDTLKNPNALCPEWEIYDEQGSYIFEGNGDGS